MNDQEMIDHLEKERTAGTKAQHAYDHYIKEFCEEKRASLFNAFAVIPLTDEEGIMSIKRMLYAIDTLENDILSQIDTGKMASKTLNENEVTH